MAYNTSNTSFSNLSVQPFFHQFENSLSSKISFKHKRSNAKQDDIYMKYPVRALGYCNEIGEALRPVIKGVATAMWIPTLGYIAMDVKDKFHRGEKDDYSEPSLTKATEEAVFQFLASITLPTLAVKLGQNFSEKLTSKNPQMFKKAVDFITKRPFLNGIINKMADSKNSGCKNLGLAIAGLTTLLILAKPIDIAVEKLLKIIFPKDKQ